MVKSVQIIGALIGIILALMGALSPNFNLLSDDVLASVNGEPISRSMLALVRERVDIPFLSDKILLRMSIDETLIIQRGLELGLLDTDPIIKKTIANAVVDKVIIESEGTVPTDTMLRLFYRENSALFETPENINLDQIFIAKNGINQKATQDRAEKALSALQAKDRFEDVKYLYSEPEPVPIPNATLPIAVLKRYLGPKLIDSILDNVHNKYTGLIESSYGFHIFKIISYNAASVIDFEDVHDEILFEYSRRKRDLMLKQKLEMLRGEAIITLSPDAPNIDNL